MKALSVLCLMVLSAAAMAQDALRPIRLLVRHADPWFVKAMLEGRQVVSPEISTIMAVTGAGPFAGAAVNALFEGGTFMVSPADNSLWFIPARR